jgi:hypothetical protein
MATDQYPTAVCGVLVDVSGSMREAYSLDRSQSVNVERTHAILTTVINIVKKEVDHHERQDSVFVSAFGLSDSIKKHFQTPRAAAYETIDLLCLLDCFADTRTDGYRALIDLAARQGAPDVEYWIRKHLSQPEARILYTALHSNESLTQELIESIRRSKSISRVGADATKIVGADALKIVGENKKKIMAG